MKSSIGSALLAVALGALPFAVSAQQLAYTAKPVNLRAGPDRYYPVIAVLPPSAAVTVYGCLPDYRWCDVGYGYDRGWVYAGNLRYPYQGGYVVFPGIAPVIGIAVLGFTLDDYWSRHYHDRPFYGERHRYAAPPPHYAPPRFHPVPPPHAGPPHGAPGSHPPNVHPDRPPPRHQPPHERTHPPQGHDRPPPGHGDRPGPPGHGDRPGPPGHGERP